MKVIKCDRCGSILDLGSAVGYVGINWRDEVGGLIEGNPFESWDICPVCMSQIREFVENKDATLNRTDSAENSMESAPDEQKLVAENASETTETGTETTETGTETTETGTETTETETETPETAPEPEKKKVRFLKKGQSKASLKDIHELLDKGYTRKQIAAELGVHPGTISRTLYIEKLNKGEPVGKRPLDLPKIHALRNAGWSYEKIGVEFSCSPQTIFNALKKEKELAEKADALAEKIAADIAANAQNGTETEEA